MFPLLISTPCDPIAVIALLYLKEEMGGTSAPTQIHENNSLLGNNALQFMGESTISAHSIK
jgi:hypothetical protein